MPNIHMTNVEHKKGPNTQTSDLTLFFLTSVLLIIIRATMGTDISRIVQLGTNLSNSLDLHVESCRKARKEGLPRLVSLVNSTASTLGRIHHLEKQIPNVFTDACMNDIQALSATCKIVYEGILLLLVKGERYNETGYKVGCMADETVESLMASLPYKGLSKDEAWEWVEPRLKICQQELTQLKLELMLRFLLGSIAHLQER